MPRYLLALALCLGLRAENLLVNQTGTAVPAGTWTLLSPAGLHPQTNGFDNLRYVKAIDRSCALMELNQITTEQNRVYWCYSVKENRWDIYSHSGSFHDEHVLNGGHSDDQIAPDMTSGQSYLVVGPYSGSQGAEVPNLTWVFDPIGMFGKIIDQTTATSTAQRNFHNDADKSMAYDPSRVDGGSQGLFMKAGLATGTVNGSGEYDPISNSFRPILANASIGAIGLGCMTYDPLDQSVYLLFGGTANVWKNHAGTWTQITPTADPTNGSPSLRYHEGCAHNRNRNRILVMGGCSTSDGPCSSGATTFMDTWALDLTQNYPNGQWILVAGTANSHTPGGNSPSPTANDRIFEKLSWSEEDDIYIAFNASGQTWAFREDPGNNVGYAPSSYTTTPGLNYNPNAWARETSLAVNGSSLLAGWIEQGTAGGCPGIGCSHPNVSQFNGTAWLSVPNPNNSQGQALIPVVPGGGFGVSGNMAVAYVSGNPWAAFNIYNTSGSLNWPIYGEEWNGANWTSVGGPIGTVGGSSPGSHPAMTKLASVNNVPTLAFTEDDWDVFPVPHGRRLYVKQWNGSVWSAPLGGGKLNRLTESGSLGSRVEHFSIVATTGANFCIAWSEYLASSTQTWDSNPQVFVSCWNGTTFVAQGASLLLDINDNGYGVSLTYISATNTLKAAFNERTGNAILKANSSANIPRIYVRSSVIGSGVWNTDGGSYLNRDPNGGWATSPSIGTDGTNSYLAFDEQGSEYNWTGSQTRLLAGGSVGHIYVFKGNGASWAILGGALNQDPVYGSATNPQLVVMGGNPVVLYQEVKVGGSAQIYVKKWTGVDWINANAASPVFAFTTPSPLSSGTQGTAYSVSVQTVNAQGSLSACASVAGSLPGGLSVGFSSTLCTVSGTPTTPGTYNFSLQATDSTSNTTASTPYQIVVNPSCTKPGIISGNPPAGTVGTAYSFQFTANGDAPLSFTATGLPTWASLDSVTGVLSGTPTATAIAGGTAGSCTTCTATVTFSNNNHTVLMDLGNGSSATAYRASFPAEQPEGTSGVHRYADPTGSGTTCSVGVPCTPQQALTGASPGDTIYINPGTYTFAARWDFNVSGTAGNPIVITATPGTIYGATFLRSDASILSTPNAETFSTNGQNYLTINGIRVRGTMNTVNGVNVHNRESCFQIGDNSHDVSFTNMVAYNGYHAGIKGGAGSSGANVSNILVDGAVVANVGSNANDHGIYLTLNTGQTPSANTLTRSIFAFVTGGGIHAYAGANSLSGWTITRNLSMLNATWGALASTSGVTWQYNEFVGNATGLMCFRSTCTGSSFLDNIIAFNTSASSAEDTSGGTSQPTGNTYDYNNYWTQAPTFGSNDVSGTHDAVTDPLLINTDLGNYQLTTTVPVVRSPTSFLEWFGGGATTYTSAVKLTIANGCGQQPGNPNSYSLLINSTPNPLTITTASLPPGTVGAPYSQTLAATGGTAPYTWSITVGSLPSGLAMSSAGVISGTPTVPITAGFTVRATDAAAATKTQALTIVVSTNLLIKSTSPLPATSIAPYAFTFQAVGGTPPYSWSLVSGTVPPGLSLANSGLLNGVPTGTGLFTFGIGVTDAASANAQGTFTLTIGAGSEMTGKAQCIGCQLK